MNIPSLVSIDNENIYNVFGKENGFDYNERVDDIFSIIEVDTVMSKISDLASINVLAISMHKLFDDWTETAFNSSIKKKKVDKNT